VSPYAASKLAGEAYCGAFADVHRFETMSLRYFNVFGPRQDHRSQYSNAIPSFAGAMLNGGRPVVYGDGRQSRDFTFVENVVEANLRAVECGGAAGGVYNVGSGAAVSLLELLGELERLTGRTAEPVHEPARAGDVRHTHADLTRARGELDYRPVVGFREGLSRTLAHYERELLSEPALA
jgi:UDP-glucose 4-epimerase